MSCLSGTVHCRGDSSARLVLLTLPQLVVGVRGLPYGTTGQEEELRVGALLSFVNSEAPTTLATPTVVDWRLFHLSPLLLVDESGNEANSEVCEVAESERKEWVESSAHLRVISHLRGTTSSNRSNSSNPSGPSGPPGAERAEIEGRNARESAILRVKQCALLPRRTDKMRGTSSPMYGCFQHLSRPSEARIGHVV